VGQIVDLSEINERITAEVGSSWFSTGCESYASLTTGLEAPNFLLHYKCEGPWLYYKITSTVWSCQHIGPTNDKYAKVAVFLTNVGGVEDVGHVNSGCGSAGTKITPLGIMQCEEPAA